MAEVLKSLTRHALCNRKTLAGWKLSQQNASSWRKTRMATHTIILSRATEDPCGSCRRELSLLSERKSTLNRLFNRSSVITLSYYSVLVLIQRGSPVAGRSWPWERETTEEQRKRNCEGGRSKVSGPETLACWHQKWEYNEWLVKKNWSTPCCRIL